jgi:hypothetical protein
MPSPLPPPAALQLARRLRQLRQQQWPEARLTQAALARALSAEDSLAAATVSSWESLSSPKLPPGRRLTAYARFFATHRSVEKATPRLLLPDELTADERDAYRLIEAELLSLRNAVEELFVMDAIDLTRMWHFPDIGPITLICARLPEESIRTLADPADPNYTALLSYADLDALVELHGHIRAENPGMDVFFKTPDMVFPDDLTGHIVLLGRIAWNELTQRLSNMTSLPIRRVQVSIQGVAW